MLCVAIAGYIKIYIFFLYFCYYYLYFHNKMRGSISDKVYNMIRKLAPGTMVFSENYLSFGPSSAVNMTFSRLAKEGSSTD